MALRESTAPGAPWTLCWRTSRVPGLNRQAECFLPALSRVDDATERHCLHQWLVGWKEMKREPGKGQDVGFGFPASRPPTPTPTPLPEVLLKVSSTSSIVLKTTSTACCPLKLLPPHPTPTGVSVYGGPTGKTLLYLWVGRFWNL